MNTTNSLAQLVEQIAEQLVLGELSDKSDLLKLRELLSSLKNISTGQPDRIYDVILRAEHLVESLETESQKVKDHDLGVLNRTISALQQVYRDGVSSEQVSFPDDLPEISCSSPLLQPKTMPKLPDYVDHELFEEFLSDQKSVLQELESLLLGFEGENQIQCVTQFKRKIHTLKGEAGMLGLKDIQRVCHEMEGVLTQRDPVSLLDDLLMVVDWLGQTYQGYAGMGTPPIPFEQLLEKIGGAIRRACGDEPVSMQMDEQPETSQETASAVAVDFPESEHPIPLLPSEKASAIVPDKSDASSSSVEEISELMQAFITDSIENLELIDQKLLCLEKNHDDTNALKSVFQGFHTIKGIAGFLEKTELQMISHQTETLLDQLRKKQRTMTDSLLNLLFEARDALKQMVDAEIAALRTGKPVTYQHDFQVLLNRLENPELLAVADNKPHSQSVLSEPDMVVDEPETFTTKQHSFPNQPLGDAPCEVICIREPIKVDAERLDQLVNMLGELVIAESMITQSPELVGKVSPHLQRQLRQLQKIAHQLQKIGMSLRMVPLKPTFHKMARMVRDLARKSGKKVELTLQGEDTELDKTVVDQISDPLLHLVRNAVDHGLEKNATDRMAAGKPEVGHVQLRSYRKGGSIYIEIEDDGRGLDREAILQKALAQGIINKEQELSDRDICNLIFVSGFSTAERVTEISGRGVGMDVVHQTVSALRGVVEIDSIYGRGSCFSIRLPLTLAIIDGMVVRVGNERYIVPTMSVVRSLKLDSARIRTVQQYGEMLDLHGDLIALFRMSRLLEIPEPATDLHGAIVVVVESDGRMVGLLVNELLGRQQIVIKSLGSYLSGAQGVSGGAILPDGKVGLILDIAGVVRMVHHDNVAVG